MRNKQNIRLLFNPFIKMAGSKAAFIGLIALIISSWLNSVYNVHLGGVIDIYLVKNLSLKTAVSENLVIVASLVIVFGLILYFLKGLRFRIIDIVGLVLFSRIPFVLAPFIGSLIPKEKLQHLLKAAENISSPQGLEEIQNELVLISLIGFVMLLLVVLFIIWLYNAFVLLNNEKSLKVNLLFAVGLVVSEIVSKIIITFI
jgi:hypothetical protein